LTLQYAAEFLRLHRVRHASFEPLGVAQGWSPSSYAYAVKELQRIGYRYIALGGMVPLKTAEILACLKAISDVRRPKTAFHLLGVTRTERVNEFSRYGVRSFDSTSPFRQSFKDARDNYYAPDHKYVAIRVMQMDGNQRVKRRVLAGELDQGRGRKLERACLGALTGYGRGDTAIERALEAVAAYTEFLAEPDQTDLYRETLEARPWEDCDCEVCRDAGIHVVIFRGTERNKRRGFHNLYAFNNQLHKELALAT
jgi:queuine/archaeosine tRNA-ribosyltransferase